MIFLHKISGLSILAILKSIRFRFVLWYALVLLITFMLFSLMLYFYFYRNLFKSFDNKLQLKAEGIAHAIETYWETERIEADKYGTKNIHNTVNYDNFIKMTKRWMNERMTNIEISNMLVQICDAKGQVIASKGRPGIISISEKSFGSVLSGNTSIDSFQPAEGSGAEPVHFHVFSMPVLENGRVTYIVQVAGSINTIENVLNNLRLILFILLPLTVLATSVFAGEFLASITLKPLKQMIETVRNITAQKTQVRISLPESKDEIKQLAETFNNMLEKIDRAMTAQKQFIQDISHELRTPLTVLKGELETTLAKVRSRGEYISVFQSNLEEINRITHMVEDLLILARYDNDQMQLKTGAVDVQALLSDIIEDMGIIASEKSVSIIYEPGVYFRIMADAEKIRRAFINIIDNAIKYTPGGGNITISAVKSGSYGRIEFADTGTGIAKEDIPHIFNRFYQADKSRRSRGYGLGLSIVRSIVSMHDGNISVKSDYGKGSVFTLEIPLFPD